MPPPVTVSHKALIFPRSWRFARVVFWALYVVDACLVQGVGLSSGFPERSIAPDPSIAGPAAYYLLDKDEALCPVKPQISQGEPITWRVQQEEISSANVRYSGLCPPGYRGGGPLSG